MPVIVLLNITLIILFITLIAQCHKYRIKVLLHPSLYFLVIWMISIISFELFLKAGFNKLVINADLLKELLIYVSFTAICFLFFGIRRIKLVRDNNIDLALSIPPSIFNAISVFFFLAAFVNLFFMSGFDVASNRQDAVSATREFYGTYGRYTIIELIFNVLNMLIVPFTFYGGWKFGLHYFGRKKQIKMVYLLPFLAGVLNVIAGGGRAGIVSSSIFFVLGLLFALFSFTDQHLLRLKRILGYIVFFTFVFLLYVSYVSIQRSKHETAHNVYLSSLENYPNLKPLYGIMEYSVFHFQGYQWRRMDSTSPELEYGRKTFSFILDFNIPILSQISGKELSLRSLLKLKDIDTVRSTIEAFRRKLPGPSITATVYYVLYDDFGYYGVFLITFIFVGVTELLFRNLFIRKMTSFWSIILFIAIYKLWSSTIFSHHLTGAWFNGYLYPILLIEILNYLAKVRPRRIEIHE